MRRPTALVLTRLKRLARLLTNEGLTPPSVLYYLAVIVAWLNRPALAGSIADAALKAADRSSNRRMFMVRQRWQFEAERWFYLAGKARVDDPLFLCCCVPMPSSKVSEAGFREAPGHYEGLWTYRGLRLDGFLTPVEGGAKYVRILVDGVLIKELTVARRTAIPPFFQLTLQRDTVAALSPTCTVEIQLPDGRRLLSGGCEQVQIKVPHGDGRIRSGLSVDKKGYLVEVGQPLEERQAAFLEIYEQASAYFRLQERSLFLLYGTLLGFHREGDFIAGDDDFDVGYFSQQADPKQVREEAMELVAGLVAAGFVVSFNRNGRLFRLRLPHNPPHVHLDVHPVWFERSRIWIHPQAKLACQPEHFVPTSSAKLRGTAVEIPSQPEAFLAAYYGTGWRVPDPSYSTAARPTRRSDMRRLANAFVSPRELQRMLTRAREISSPSEPKGALVSIGSFSLYPLDRYQTYCE